MRQFDDFVDDFLQFVHSMPLEAGQKRFLLGHSMGGLISVLAASRVSLLSDCFLLWSLTMLPQEPELFDALILSSPFLMLDDDSQKKAPLLLPVIRLVSSYLPKLIIAPGLPANFVSKDPVIVANYLNDPLNCAAVGIRARFLAEVERVQSMLRADKYSKMTMPFLVMQVSGKLYVRKSCISYIDACLGRGG